MGELDQRCKDGRTDELEDVGKGRMEKREKFGRKVGRLQRVLLSQGKKHGWTLELESFSGRKFKI